MTGNTWVLIKCSHHLDLLFKWLVFFSPCTFFWCFDYIYLTYLPMFYNTYKDADSFQNESLFYTWKYEHFPGMCKMLTIIMSLGFIWICWHLFQASILYPCEQWYGTDDIAHRYFKRKRRTNGSSSLPECNFLLCLTEVNITI